MAATKKKITRKINKSKVNPETGLTTQQEEFFREYLGDFNGKRAAIEAGYSAKTAAQQASRLLTNVKGQAFLATLQKPALQKFEVTQDKIMKEIATVAFSNLMDYVEVKNGQAWIDLSKCTREQAAALASFEVIELPPLKMYEDGEEVVREVLKVKIKMWDKLKALELLAKRYGLVQPDPATTINNNTQININIENKADLAKQVAFMLRSEAERKKKETAHALPAPASTPANPG